MTKPSSHTLSSSVTLFLTFHFSPATTPSPIYHHLLACPLPGTWASELPSCSAKPLRKTETPHLELISFSFIFLKKPLSSMASKKHQRNGSAISVHFVKQDLDAHAAPGTPAAPRAARWPPGDPEDPPHPRPHGLQLQAGMGL